MHTAVLHCYVTSVSLCSTALLCGGVAVVVWRCGHGVMCNYLNFPIIPVYNFDGTKLKLIFFFR